MKLYLGDSQDTELDLNDEETVYLYPTATARGGYWNIKKREAYLAECWDGTIKTMKYFSYKNISEEEAKEAAKLFFEEKNKNTIDSIIEIKAKDIDEKIIKNFRYVQPSIEYPNKSVPIDPYWLGLWLGNGSDKDTKIYTNEKVLQDYIKSKKIECIKLEELGMFDNKHFPDMYLKNSKEVRLQLLAGLIDIAGSRFDNDNHYEIINNNSVIYENIKILANSLGFFVKLGEKIVNSSNGSRYVYKRLNIFVSYNTPSIPLLIESKNFDKEKIKTIQGVRISFKKKEAAGVWTQEMKDCLEETIQKYTVKKRVQWTKIVQNEELYKNMSAEALKAYNRDRNKI